MGAELIIGGIEKAIMGGNKVKIWNYYEENNTWEEEELTW